MGIEYQIRFSHPTDGAIDEAIRALPFFRDYDDQNRLYNLWVNPRDLRPGMPDAHAMIKDHGLYFCDNCGENTALIKDALIALARQFDADAVFEEL